MGAQDTDGLFGKGAHKDIKLKPEKNPILILTGLAVTDSSKFKGYGAAHSSIDLIKQVNGGHDHGDRTPRRTPSDEMGQVKCPRGYTPFPKCTNKQSSCPSCPMCPHDGKRWYPVHSNGSGAITAEDIFPKERGGRYYRVCKRLQDYQDLPQKLKCCQPWDQKDVAWEWLNNEYANTQFSVPTSDTAFNRSRCGPDLWDYGKNAPGSKCDPVFAEHCLDADNYNTSLCATWFASGTDAEVADKEKRLDDALIKYCNANKTNPRCKCLTPQDSTIIDSSHEFLKCHHLNCSETDPTIFKTSIMRKTQCKTKKYCSADHLKLTPQQQKFLITYEIDKTCTNTDPMVINKTPVTVSGAENANNSRLGDTNGVGADNTVREDALSDEQTNNGTDDDKPAAPAAPAAPPTPPKKDNEKNKISTIYDDNKSKWWFYPLLAFIIFIAFKILTGGGSSSQGPPPRGPPRRR